MTDLMLMPWQNQSSQPVVILGASRTGVATARFLNALGVPCLLSDAHAIKPAFEADMVELQTFGVTVESGSHAQAECAEHALVVVSPGLKPTTPLLQRLQAQECVLTSDIALALRWLQDHRSAQSTVGITGTNGKTTTTLLTAHVLNALNTTAIACGNVGIPVFEVLHQARISGMWPEVLVFEISSAQWHYSQSLLPNGWPWTMALLTGFEADHLDWHGSLEAYAQAKIAMFAHARKVVLPADCSLNADIQAILPSETPCFVTGSENSGADLRFQTQSPFDLVLAEIGPLASLQEWQLPGAHNRQNAAMAALTAWTLLKPSYDKLSQALCSFSGVEHRLELLPQEHTTLTVFNDSKSTTPGATITALRTLQEDPALARRPLHLLMGGRDKGTPLGDLENSLARHEAPCAIWLYGEAADRFAEGLTLLVSQTFCVNQVTTFEEAVSGAWQHAMAQAAHDPVILLSPACASFDEFSDYEARGRRFKALIQENITAKLPL